MKIRRRVEEENIIRVKITNYDELKAKAENLPIEIGKIFSEEELEEIMKEKILERLSEKEYGIGTSFAITNREETDKAFFWFKILEEGEIEAEFQDMLIKGPSISLENYEELVLKWQEEKLPIRQMPSAKELISYVQVNMDYYASNGGQEEKVLQPYVCLIFSEEEEKPVARYTITYAADCIKNGKVKIKELKVERE